MSVAPACDRGPDGGFDRAVPQRRPRGPVVIISASVGAGHDGAAAALAHEFTEAGFTVTRLDFLQLLPTGMGPLVRGGYHRLLRIAPHWYERIYTRTGARAEPSAAVRLVFASALERVAQAIPADAMAVVSTHPGATQVLGALRRTGRLSVPAFAYLTDFSVHPFQVANGIDLHLATNAIAARQARAAGADQVATIRPAVRPTFSPPGPGQQGAARAQFGLPLNGELALLVAGSWGVGPVRQVAAELAHTRLVAPVVVCGTNRFLAAGLRRDGIDHVFGWVEDMRGLMHAADVLVQNAGGLTCVEALASGLPVLSYCCIPGHGQTNAAVLDQAGLATWVLDPARLAPVLDDLLIGPAGRRQRSAGLDLLDTGAHLVDVVSSRLERRRARTWWPPPAKKLPLQTGMDDPVGRDTPTVR